MNSHTNLSFEGDRIFDIYWDYFKNSTNADKFIFVVTAMDIFHTKKKYIHMHFSNTPFHNAHGYRHSYTTSSTESKASHTAGI